MDYHLAHLSVAIAAASPALFANYLAWSKVVLVTRNVLLEDVAADRAALVHRHRAAEHPALAAGGAALQQDGPGQAVPRPDPVRERHVTSAQSLRSRDDGMFSILRYLVTVRRATG